MHITKKNIKGIVNLPLASFDKLKADGQIIVNGITYIYSPLDTIYITPDMTEEQIKDLNERVDTSNTLIIGLENNITDLQDVAADLSVKKANKTISAEYTLLASGWSNNQYILTIIDKTTSNNALVSNSNIGTAEEVLANSNAIADANIYQIIDNGTSLTFICETTPTTNIKINVEVYD